MFAAGIINTIIMTYGNPALTNVSSAEAITNITCTNPAAGAITATVTGGIPPYSYSLNGGAFQASNTFTGLAKGTATLTIKDGGCQTLTKTVTIGLTNNLTLTTTPATDTSVCAGATVPLAATSPAGATYQWTPATGLTNAVVNNPTATVYNNIAYTVTASLNGCTKTQTIPVTVKPGPTVDAGPDKTIVSGSSVTLEGSGSAGNILWSPAASLSNANIFTPLANPTTTTQYTLTVTDANNCRSSDDVLVTVLPWCVKPMKAFTPNGDGINDKWFATTGGGCTSKVSVVVYNRYGHTVYANENYQNDWNGTYKGETIPDATYYYAITYLLIDGRTITLSGDVTILR
ncbi:C-terminal domain of CHU protein family-domain-containing protein [Russula earlei]|uniref:C-terminal domain of CHU protein family-domain-containing protein n=1 Tax=Russula earlei TaxID=71964 RepID=A0ACC0TQL1_9AGAM|nr:C-terminal domain of CHU protein family-domain-containing protein [Russula earlei]